MYTVMFIVGGLVFSVWMFEYNLCFRIAVLNKFILYRFHKMIKFSSKMLDLADIGLSMSTSNNNLEVKKEIMDTLLQDMNDLNYRYEFIMTKIDAYEKDYPNMMRVIYQNDFTRCIDSVASLEEKYNLLIRKYK